MDEGAEASSAFEDFEIAVTAKKNDRTLMNLKIAVTCEGARNSSSSSSAGGVGAGKSSFDSLDVIHVLAARARIRELELQVEDAKV